MTALRVWSYVDDAGDHACLREREDTVIAQLDAANVWLTVDGARGLRDALNRLLDDDAGAETAQDLHAAQQQLQVRVRRIADQLGEHTTELAGVAGRAQEADIPFGHRIEDLANLTEIVHRLAVQQQRVAASLGDLLSAIAGES